MTKTFEDNLSIEIQMELEKQSFGGTIYAMSHKFPSIYITNNKEKVSDNCYRLESFINMTKLINTMADNCGSDLSLLLAEAYKLHDIDDDTIPQNDLRNKVIISICSESLANLSLAVNQSEKILQSIDSYDKNEEINLEIIGNNYCFIVMMLNNLFFYYTSAFNFISNKTYIDIAYIKTDTTLERIPFTKVIHERLSLFVSDEFESLRRMFKVIECYKAIENKPTFH